LRPPPRRDVVLATDLETLPAVLPLSPTFVFAPVFLTVFFAVFVAVFFEDAPAAPVFPAEVPPRAEAGVAPVDVAFFEGALPAAALLSVVLPAAALFMADPFVADCRVVADLLVVDGFLVDGFLVDGFLVDGFLVDGFLVDGFLVEDFLIASLPDVPVLLPVLEGVLAGDLDPVLDPVLDRALDPVLAGIAFVVLLDVVLAEVPLVLWAVFTADRAPFERVGLAVAVDRRVDPVPVLVLAAEPVLEERPAALEERPVALEERPVAREEGRLEAVLVTVLGTFTTLG